MQKIIAGDRDSFFVCVFGPRHAFVVRRGSATMAVEPMMPLEQGDIVAIDVAACKHLRFPPNAEVAQSGKVATIDCADPQITIASTAERPSTLTAAVGILWKLLWPIDETAYTQESISAVSRGEEPIEASILRPEQRISYQASSIVLPWSGGTAPFHVVIKNRSGRLVFEGSTNRRSIAIKGLSLRQGTYQILIADAASYRASASLNVTNGALPQAPTPDMAAFPDPQTARLWYATWLVSTQGARYKLAAYDTIAPDADTFEAAKVYGQRLAGDI